VTRVAGVTRAALVVGLALSLLSADAAPADDASRIIGRSRKDRPIRAVAVGDLGARRRILVVGSIHGNERAGMQITRRLKRISIPEDVELWTIRTANPDGVVAGTRQNARGVDLNRNFPYRWRSSGTRWSTYYPGPRRASEPETRAAMAFIKEIRPRITIWYHQALDMVVRSSGKYWIQRKYARLTGLRLARLPFYRGTATSWQNHKYPGATAFVVELPAGRLPFKAVKRHTRAVLALARM
jgi:murein peptide amidase A